MLKLKKYYQSVVGKTVKGFIQSFSLDPLAIRLWTEDEIEIYHKRAKNVPLLVDATCGIISAVNDKRVFYFAIIIHNGMVKTEPIPVFQFMTDKPDEQSFLSALNLFLCDEKKRYGYQTFTVPLVAICDISWSLIKSLIMTYNKLSLFEYVDICYKLVTGAATEKELPSKVRLLIVQICMSHTMEIFTFHAKKYITKGHRSLIVYACSVLVNSSKFSQLQDAIEHLFTMLLSEKENSHLQKSKRWQ